MKIVMTRDDVKDILLRYIFTNYSQTLGIDSPDEIELNTYDIAYNDLVFQKKETVRLDTKEKV
jgi:hypothetical protein